MQLGYENLDVWNRTVDFAVRVIEAVNLFAFSFEL
jgi:hypothetical protein